MSHRRELEEHRHKLDDIREIMNSMKTMAYMETRKLAHFLDAQLAVFDAIESAAADFVCHYPETLPTYSESFDVYLLIGSERGFCGNFNTVLMEHYEAEETSRAIKGSVPPCIKIAVGRKLHTTMEETGYKPILIDGANVVEEVDLILASVIATLSKLQKEHGILSLTVLYHGANEHEVLMERLLPPFEQYSFDQSPSNQSGTNPEKYSHAPLINIPANDLLLELSEHYLFAALYKILYISLMAENHSRVEHLETAVEKLDEKLLQLVRQENRVRQEDIIEEIEIILLSADNLTRKMRGHARN